MDSVSKVRYRACLRQDLDRLVEFAQRMKKEHSVDFLPQSPQAFLAKYSRYNSSSNELNMSILESSDSRIIGCTGYIPFQGLFAGQSIKGFLGTDAAIDPESRKILPNLAPVLAHSYEHLVRLERLLPLACPANPKVSQDFQKVQWRRFATIYRFSHPSLARFVPDKESPLYQIREVDILPAQLNIFFKKVSRQHFFLMNTDVDFLNWKYFKNPYNNYRVMVAFRQGQILGYIVTQSVYSDTSIVDCVIDLDHPDLLILLICKSLSYCPQPQIARTFFYLSHKDYISILKKAGFISTWAVECLFFKVGLIYCKIDQNLFYQADSDYYHFNGFDQFFY
ncbi:MAG: hypothetical protein JW867_02980 [Candidatus Omnitrophica bacterium]|nr:hypothetical protein [Candidatus Omnitrophota bacterium]